MVFLTGFQFTRELHGAENQEKLKKNEFGQSAVKNMFCKEDPSEAPKTHPFCTLPIFAQTFEPSIKIEKILQKVRNMTKSTKWHVRPCAPNEDRQV